MKLLFSILRLFYNFSLIIVLDKDLYFLRKTIKK